jgi:lipoprotein-anchoring transpeptidase ErfK/SrfK
VKLKAPFAALLAATALIVPLRAAVGGNGNAKTTADLQSASLPISPRSALEIRRPERLSSDRFLSRWTTVRSGGALAHTRPSAAAPVTAELSARTAEGTPNAVPVLGSRSDATGRLWVEVRLPVVPSGRVGWVRRQTLGGYEVVDTHLVIHRKRLTATLYRNGRVVFTSPIGVGADSSPTPGGEFLVRSQLTRYANPSYGPVAFGTTARSETLTDWPGGGFVGIHGTDEPQLIPGRVSHGCVRMRNADIMRLARLMPVGTPLTIR